VLYERVKKIPVKQRENLINTLNVLERFLNQNSWFAGNEMTIADISIVPTITTIKVKIDDQFNWQLSRKNLRFFY